MEVSEAELARVEAVFNARLPRGWKKEWPRMA